MKRKLLILVAALFVFGLTIGAHGVISNRSVSPVKASCCDCCKGKAGQTAAVDAKDSCCDMDCCKDDHCPMKDKQAADQSADMSKVVFVGGEDSCCSPGADCCKGGSCCHKKG